MKISGFTVVRNAVKMGYPVLQSIKSILPLVDEFVVGVGQSDDGTKELLNSIGAPHLRIFDSYWDTTKTRGGLILSEKTNEALEHCQNEWCFYLQADEVVHESDLIAIREQMQKYENDSRVEGLLFDYVHFYGSYDVIATSRQWYRKEVRVVRKSSGIQSHGDAQGFRVNGRKPRVKLANGRIFHYGWVKPPEQMGEKSKLLNFWWHGNARDNEFKNFQYRREYGLRKFTGSHPKVMGDLLKTQNWEYDPSLRWQDMNLDNINLWASDCFEKLFRFRIGEYKPYRIIRN